MNLDKNNLNLIYEASMAQQRELMKEIQKRKAAGQSVLTPAEREAILNKKIDVLKGEYLLEGFLWPMKDTDKLEDYKYIKKYYHADPLTPHELPSVSDRSMRGWCSENLFYPILDQMGYAFNNMRIISERDWDCINNPDEFNFDNGDTVHINIAPLYKDMIISQDIWSAKGYAGAFPKSGVYVVASVISKMFPTVLLCFHGMMYRKDPDFVLDVNGHRATYKTNIVENIFPHNSLTYTTSVGSILSNFA